MIQEALPHLPSKNGEANKSNHNYSPEIESAESLKKSSTLIEFPGSRSVPEWRKQLSKRVREVQERKAREAAEELAAAQEAGLVSCALPSGQLELVPDLENPVVNPIVSKALERLERARRTDYSPVPHATVAVTPEPVPETELFATPEEIDETVVEPKTKLTVVAPPHPVVEPVDIAAEEFAALDSIAPAIDPAVPELPQVESTIAEATIEIEAEQLSNRTRIDRKPIRVISDNDIALSYLETCLSVPALATDTRSDVAGLTRRFFAGIVDLLLIAAIVSPAAVAIHYYGNNWADPRTIGLIGAIAAATMFAYLTICTAMTGRTLATRLFGMRIIDLRTGLIPTGGQSIARAITFVFSFALLGLGLAYALIDPDNRTVPDRASKTIIIRS